MLNEKGSKSNKEGAFAQFMKKNKSLVFLLPVLLIAIIVVVVMYTKPKNKQQPAIPTSAEAQQKPDLPNDQKLQVEILPQMERVKLPEELNLSRVTDPFTAGETGETVEQSLSLKGIVLSENTSTAIIETGSRAYIVSVGDSIDSFWHVESIEEKSVILTDINGSSLILALK
ncbi:MAG: hypothetical protein KBA53_13300 [Thermoclostridium sp.]|nr:hypothetical protein [Thermoclostridium sp.]